ncbi:MAG: hypothetical protein IIY05_03760 [Alistipes sp.]|nr:hypothetical protein [Alistipes sp.]
MKNNKNNFAAGDGKIFIEESDLQWLQRSERWGVDSPQPKDAQGGSYGVVQKLIAKPIVEPKVIDVDVLTRITSSDIIDKFLRTDTHRIVAEEGEVDSEIVTEAELSDDDDMVSEELAEVYLAQGLKDMAIETYRKLSLLNPEKSIYFAEIISKIEG